MRVIQWSRTPTTRFQEALEEFNEEHAPPRVFVKWAPNPIPSDATPAGVTGPKAKDQEGRWEIWVEVRDVTHPEHRYIDPDSNYVWDNDHRCWTMKLQSWEHADGSYASLGRHLLGVLRLGDTWRRDKFYEKHVEEPYNEKQQENREEMQDLILGARDTYKNAGKPSISVEGDL